LHDKNQEAESLPTFGFLLRRMRGSNKTIGISHCNLKKMAKLRQKIGYEVVKKRKQFPLILSDASTGKLQALQMQGKVHS